MKSVGIITYHGSHNYGSMLQAYALQQTVLKLGYKCEIINFRTERQKRFYRPFFCSTERRRLLKALIFPVLAYGDMRKYRRFEKFLCEKLILSEKEYATGSELKNAAPTYDAYVSGSDQIWNTYCFDFDSVYFLDFVKNGRKIAYAPSMGPKPLEEVSSEYYSMIRDNVRGYDAVSVREALAASLVKEISGIEAEVTLDPTLLIPEDEWRIVAGEKPLVDNPYLLLYTPWYNEHLYEAAARLAEKLDLDVVCTIHDSYLKWRKNRRFHFRLATGPVEFLNLVMNSRYVVSGSFHAVVFSIIFRKPFYTLNGKADSRVAPLLAQTHLEHFAEFPDEIITDNQSKLSSANKLLQPLIDQSITYLKNSL